MINLEQINNAHIKIQTFTNSLKTNNLQTINKSNPLPPTPQKMNHQTMDRDYLIKQNRKLKMQLKQSNNLKQLHQQALMQINQLYPQSKVIGTLIQIISQTSNKTKLNELNDIIMQLQGQVMVLQKIAAQTQENQKQTYNLLAQQFQKLREQNTKISDQLHKFYQKIGQVDYISGLVTKYKQIISTTQQAMAFKKQQQQLLDALNIQQQTIKKISEQKDKLMRINIHMKQEVQKKKDEVRNMTMMLFCQGQGQEVDTGNVLDELDNGEVYSGNNNGNTLSNQNIEQLYAPNSERSNLSMNRFSKLNISKLNTSIAQNNPNTTLNFIKMQRQLLKDVKQQDQMKSSITNESDMDCPELSILFPDKVQHIIKIKQQAKVPYLNMKKVRQMMAKREQKMRKQLQQQKPVNPTTKIIQLQTQLEITRKQLSSQTLKFRIMSEDLKSIRFKIDQLQKRNQLLVESNFKLKNNYHNIYKDYQVCKGISSQVERALGLIVGQDNQQKVREKLGAILGTFAQIRPSDQNQLQETVRDQFKAQRLLQIFDSKNAFRTESKRNHSV